MPEAKKLTAVIADDAELMRTIVRTALELLEISIVGEAENGREAVDLSIEHEPDIIMLDILMPEMNGYHALEEIVGRMHEPFVVMMTSIDDDEVIQSCMLAGAQDYIRKDQPVPEIVARLKKHRDILARHKK